MCRAAQLLDVRLGFVSCHVMHPHLQLRDGQGRY
ncbi:hypothetical protein LINPERPRIM_LOCUS34108 [Linum perenne]